MLLYVSSTKIKYTNFTEELSILNTNQQKKAVYIPATGHIAPAPRK
jgi:hypothetical protein